MTTRKQAEDKFLNVNGLNLHYLDWGGPDEKALLLIHGLTSNAHSWDFFAPHLCRDFHVYALDLRGHGDSDHARDGYWVTLFASDIHEFARTLDITHFDLCGLSLGARVGIAYAGEHPEALKHIVLVDFGPEMDVTGASRVMQNVAAPPMGFRNKEKAMEYIEQAYPGIRPEFLENQAEHSFKVNWAGRLVYKYDRELFWITGSAGKKEVPYLWEQLPKITRPTLVMRGARSDILSPGVARRMLDLLPNGHFVEIPDAGHAIPIDNPEAFEKALRDFLST